MFDEETGLYYLRSRYYSAEKSRFISADKVEKNLYCYCINSPLINVDENGLWGENIILRFMKDEYAKIIVNHWIYGAGEDLNITYDNNWDEYITSNFNFIEMIAETAYDAFLQGETSFGVYRGSITLSSTGKGGYRTGYDLLNGSNLIKGGFSFEGEIICIEDNYYITGTYSFKDRVDAEEKYLDDLFWESVVRLFLRPGEGVDYDISIIGSFNYPAFGFSR